MGHLEKYIREKVEGKGQLIMTHQLLGYPDFETNQGAIEIFVKKKVDLIELQIPFSDPGADGPLFVKANQEAIEKGVTVAACFNFVENQIKTTLYKAKIPVMIMTYYNIVLRYGVNFFLDHCKRIGVVGLIIPDAPLEECPELFQRGRLLDIAIIPIGTPVTSESRLQLLTQQGGGFLYYVPRKGVTGYKTDFQENILQQIEKVKNICNLPVAVGFGIQTKEDIKKLKGISSIAVLGSELLRAIDMGGVEELESRMDEIMEDV